MRRTCLLMFLVSLAACSKQDPLFCDGTHACSDPSRPFCDVNGEFAASDGVKNTCIASPFDAGTSTDGGPPDGAAGACDGSPNGTTKCTGSTLMTCEAGTWAQSDCPLGCYTDGTRCWDVDPSNGLGTYLDKASSGPDLVLTDGAVIHANGGIKNGDGSTVDGAQRHGSSRRAARQTSSSTRSTPSS